MTVIQKLCRKSGTVQSVGARLQAVEHKIA